MFKISTELQQAYANAAVENCIYTIDRHLCKVFPDAMSDVSETDRTVFIRLSIAKAKRYGINCQQGVAQYCGAMFRLGAFFDESPVFKSQMLPLLKLEHCSSSAKGKMLNEKAFEILQRHYGSQGRLIVKRALRLRKQNLALFFETLRKREYEVICNQLAAKACPERFDGMSPQAQGLFLNRSRQMSETLEFMHPTEQGYYFTVSLIIGYRFHEDPLFSALKTVLHDNPDPNNTYLRVNKMHQQLLGIMERRMLQPLRRQLRERKQTSHLSNPKAADGKHHVV